MFHEVGIFDEYRLVVSRLPLNLGLPGVSALFASGSAFLAGTAQKQGRVFLRAIIQRHVMSTCLLTGHVHFNHWVKWCLPDFH